MTPLIYPFLSTVGKSEFMNNGFNLNTTPIHYDIIREIVKNEFPTSLSKSRATDVIALRFSIIAILYKYRHLLGFSLIKIGKVFHKDHATVLHAVRKVKEWHDVNGYEKELETFEVVRKIMVKHINRLI